MVDENKEDLEDRIYNQNALSTISSKTISDKLSSTALNDLKHYLCPLCHTFPKLILKENRKVRVFCEEIKGLEFYLNDYMEYYLSKGDIKKYTLSDSINKYIGYCLDCKINFSNNNSNKHKLHNIKYFKDISEEKLNFIKKKLNLPEIYKESPKSGTSISTNQNNNTGTSYILESVNDEEMRKVKRKNEIDNLYANNPFSELIQIIINDLKFYPNYTHYENIKNIFYYLSDQMEIEYHNFENGNLDIRIFGENFVKNNINNFILFIDGKEEKLKEIIKVKGPNETLKIKLIKINEITDLSDMFCKCDGLSNINIINEWNTSNVTTMSGMFYGCRALEKIPDISKWVTNKTTDLSSMFEGCEIIESRYVQWV